MFKIVILLCLSASIQYCMNNIGPCYFNAAPMWPKSYHITGPKSTFLHHLVHHRILSKTLTQMHIYVYACTVAHTHACIHVHTHTHTHTHTHIHIHAYVYIHTHTHMHTGTRTHPPTNACMHLCRRQTHTNLATVQLHKFSKQHYKSDSQELPLTSLILATSYACNAL